MSGLSRRLQWVTWGGLAAVIAVIGGAFLLQKRSAGPSSPVLGSLSRLELTNQMGQPVGLQTLRGRVWVADIIFTRCAGPCVGLTKTMVRVQQALDPSLPAGLISLTADPELDIPRVLKDYGDRYGAAHDRWHFLTGPKSEVQRVAADEFKFVVVDNSEKKSPDDDLFVHSTRLAIVDRAGRIRAYVDADDPDCVDRVVALVKELAAESAP